MPGAESNPLADLFCSFNPFIEESHTNHSDVNTEEGIDDPELKKIEEMDIIFSFGGKMLYPIIYHHLILYLKMTRAMAIIMPQQFILM